MINGYSVYVSLEKVTDMREQLDEAAWIWPNTQIQSYRIFPSESGNRNETLENEGSISDDSGREISPQIPPVAGEKPH
jgi:hypothetical protein